MGLGLRNHRSDNEVASGVVRETPVRKENERASESERQERERETDHQPSNRKQIVLFDALDLYQGESDSDSTAQIRDTDRQDRKRRFASGSEIKE